MDAQASGRSRCGTGQALLAGVRAGGSAPLEGERSALSRGRRGARDRARVATPLGRAREEKEILRKTAVSSPGRPISGDEVPADRRRRRHSTPSPCCAVCSAIPEPATTAGAGEPLGALACRRQACGADQSHLQAVARDLRRSPHPGRAGRRLRDPAARTRPPFLRRNRPSGRVRDRASSWTVAGCGLRRATRFATSSARIWTRVVGADSVAAEDEVAQAL